MRVGKRANRIEIWKRGTTADSFGETSGETLWKTVWGDIVAERGAELTIAGEREVQTYAYASFDYLDLCEGRWPGKFAMDQSLGAMRLVDVTEGSPGVSYDIDAIKPDYIHRRDVVLRLVQKSGGN